MTLCAVFFAVLKLCIIFFLPLIAKKEDLCRIRNYFVSKLDKISKIQGIRAPPFVDLFTLKGGLF